MTGDRRRGSRFALGIVGRRIGSERVRLRRRHQRRQEEEDGLPADPAPHAYRPSRWMGMYTSHDTANAPGIVRIHAHTTRPATPQRTAESRWVEPTPTMAPVMVWVVDTGMPAWAVKNSVAAAAVSALIPLTGWSLVIFDPMVCTMRHPPDSVPSAIAACADRTTHSGTPAVAGLSFAPISRARITPMVFCASLAP